MTDDAAGTQTKKNVQGPKLARRQGAGSRGLKVREPHALYRLLHRTAFAPPNVPCTFLGLTVLCHFEPQLVWRVIVCTLVLIIGITTSIGLCAALYDLAKSLSDRDSILPDERGDDLFVPTILCKIMTTVSFIVVLLACATSARVLLAAEAERVLLQKLLETKSTRAWPSQWHQEMDASLAIPVAPTTVCPFGQGCSIEIDWARPVVASTTVYHLQWREQQEQEWSSWGEVSENIGRPLFGHSSEPCCTMVGLRTHTAYQFRVCAFNVSERWGPWSPPSEPTTVIEAGRSPFSVYVKKPKVPFSLCRFVCVSVFFVLGVAADAILSTNLHPINPSRTPSVLSDNDRFAFITFCTTFSGLLYVFAVLPLLLGFPFLTVLCVAAVVCGILVGIIAMVLMVLMVLPWFHWLGFNATVIVGIIAFSVSIPVTCACLLWPKRHVRAMDTTKTMAGANQRPQPTRTLGKDDDLRV